jgi:hypothetical protein
MSIQSDFVKQVVDKIKDDQNVLGLAVAGSWITAEIDSYSDVDLVLVTVEKVAPDREQMIVYARQFGDLINNFTGEHVGEPRLLICLYNNPLIHVDIKFLVREEFYARVEDPIIAWEREDTLSSILASTKSEWPKIDYQWIEDRFWTWVHYIAAKIGRGENFEALESLSFIRANVTAPLLQLKNGKLPRGLRKVEVSFDQNDMQKLVATVPEYSTKSIIRALLQTIDLYQQLRTELYPDSVVFHEKTQAVVLEYLELISRQVLNSSDR